MQASSSPPCLTCSLLSGCAWPAPPVWDQSRNWREWHKWTAFHGNAFTTLKSPQGYFLSPEGRWLVPSWPGWPTRTSHWYSWGRTPACHTHQSYIFSRTSRSREHFRRRTPWPSRTPVGSRMRRGPCTSSCSSSWHWTSPTWCPSPGRCCPASWTNSYDHWTGAAQTCQSLI